MRSLIVAVVMIVFAGCAGVGGSRVGQVEPSCLPTVAGEDVRSWPTVDVVVGYLPNEAGAPVLIVAVRHQKNDIDVVLVYLNGDGPVVIYDNAPNQSTYYVNTRYVLPPGKDGAPVVRSTPAGACEWMIVRPQTA